MYEMSKQSFDVSFRSFVSVFPNASLWISGTNALFVATVEPFQIDYHNLTERMQDPVVKADLDSIGIHSPPELLSLMLMGPDEVKKYLASVPGTQLNTDDNAYLEYHVPFDLPEKSDKLVGGLLPYASLDLRDISNISPEETEQVRQAWERQEVELQEKMKPKPKQVTAKQP